jgi:hypothetical protein
MGVGMDTICVPTELGTIAQTLSLDTLPMPRLSGHSPVDQQPGDLATDMLHEVWSNET